MDIYKMNIFSKGKISALALLSSIVLMKPAGAVKFDFTDHRDVARIASAAHLLRVCPDVFVMVERVKTYPKNINPRPATMENLLLSFTVLASSWEGEYMPHPKAHIPLESLKKYLAIKVDDSSDEQLLDQKRDALVSFQMDFFDFLKESGACKYVGEDISVEEEKKIRSQEQDVKEAALIKTGARLVDTHQWTDEEVDENSVGFSVLALKRISCMFHDSEQTYFRTLINFIEGEPPSEISSEYLLPASNFINEMEKLFHAERTLSLHKAVPNLESFVRKVHGTSTSYDELLSYYKDLEEAKKSGNQDQLSLPSNLSEAHHAAEKNPELFEMLRRLIDQGSLRDNKELAVNLRNDIIFREEICKYFRPVVGTVKEKEFVPLRTLFLKRNSPQVRQTEEPVAKKINAAASAGDEA